MNRKRITPRERLVLCQLKQNSISTAVRILFLAALFSKYLLYGMAYFPILDDYIPYGTYPLFHDLDHVYFGIGILSTRPFASLLDPILWGQMWNHMSLALCLITLMHFFSAVLFEEVLKKSKLSVSPVFYLIFLLFPLGTEATYWIGASTRIVVGMLFCAAALYCLIGYIEKRRVYQFVLFFLFSFFSCGFYEDVLVFHVVSALLLIVFHWRRIRHKWVVCIVPALSAAFFCFYYKIASQIGAMGSRASSFSLSNMPERLGHFFSQLGEIMQAGSYQTTIKGFGEGLGILFQSGAMGILCLLCIAFTGMMLGLLIFNHQADRRGWKALLICGIILFFLPLTPHILVPNVWLTYRVVFVSFVGLALVLEAVFALIVRNRTAAAIQAVFLSVVMVLFGVANVNEYDTYRRVSQDDQVKLDKVIEKLDDGVKSGEKEAVIVLSQEPVLAQVSFYKDHVKSVFDSDWALTGAIRAQSKNVAIKKVTPVLSWEYYETEDKQVLYLNNQGEVVYAQ